ncbi:septum site-determining protein Ssd [Mycolicibacterium sp.]|uniref:septum site-determining protein Ssd n=1 Tax=Mycolicibacterium sp. TaxID=2320850 RepID=UPI003D0BCCA4
MTSPAAILAVVDDPALNTDIDRVAAAAGLALVRTETPSSQRVWTSAAAVLVDTAAALRCAQRGLPRRAGVLLVAAEPGPGQWEAAVAVGAQQVLALPGQDQDLMAVLADAVEAARDGGTRGPVIAMLAGRGGAGASVFATALAQTCAESLLIDADPWGGGLDLLLGNEAQSGLRWPDLALAGGRVSYSALRDALPRRDGVSVLATSRVFSDGHSSNDVDALPLAAVIDAGSRGGVTVVCDVARQPTLAAEAALGAADLVVLLTTADVRSAAATAATARWALVSNPNVGVVVRGPAPGGLRPRDVAGIVGVPVLAAMRPEPGIEVLLERGGLRPRRRSPLRAAAREVLAVLCHNPHLEQAAEPAA